MAQCTTDRDRQVDPCQRCQPNPDPARSSARRQYQQTVQKLIVSAQRNDQSKEVIRHVMHHVSHLRGHLHLLALRTSFRSSRFYFPLPPHPFLENTTKTRTSLKLAGQTCAVIERWFSTSSWVPSAHAAGLKNPDLTSLGLKALRAFAQHIYSSRHPRCNTSYIAQMTFPFFLPLRRSESDRKDGSTVSTICCVWFPYPPVLSVASTGGHSPVSYSQRIFGPREENKYHFFQRRS